MVVARSQHPLEITLVLDTLIRHIPLEELPNYRLVCKSWFVSSIKKWRANKTLVLKPGTSYPKESDIISFEFYMLNSFPYTKLVVDGQKTSLKPLLARPCSFWKPLLDTMTHITFKNINIYFNFDSFLHMILFLIPNVTDLVLERNFWGIGVSIQSPVWLLEKMYTSKLKRFTVTGNADDRRCEVQMYIPWDLFFNHFPTLESIEVSNVCFAWSQLKYFFHVLFSMCNPDWRRRPGERQSGLHLKSMKLVFFKQPIMEDTLLTLSKLDDGITQLCDVQMPELTTLVLDLGIPLEAYHRQKLTDCFPRIQIGNH